MLIFLHSCKHTFFIDLSKNLEDDVSSVIKNHMKTWREENLHLGMANSINLESESDKGAKRSNKSHLPSRVFIPRQTLLNELFVVNHIQSVYNIFAAILFILFLHEVLEEVTETGRINLELSSLYFAFAEFDKALIIWLYMKSATAIFVYLGFHYWAHNRHKHPYTFDVVGAVLYSAYISYFMFFPVKALLDNNLGIASSIAVLSEQVRMIMKTWAFVWANLDRALHFKKLEKTSTSSPCPDFSHYIYFLFAPTLVYRDEYPRNATCNWRKVAKDFAQVIGCLFYAHFLFARFCGPVFRQFGMEEFSHTRLIKAGFSSCFPGFLLLLCGFFLILHSWMNAFAEMLRFADRLFYKDWWNSTSYPRRTWNCIRLVYEYSRQPKVVSGVVLNSCQCL
ncbi:Sterol O-acyltransferase 1 [Armadillidium vulgare]|nr:Sterol O-acyltransferase 1 [Armadillidium vulgare]